MFNKHYRSTPELKSYHNRMAVATVDIETERGTYVVLAVTVADQKYDLIENKFYIYI